jgi:hypothetical protein
LSNAQFSYVLLPFCVALAGLETSTLFSLSRICAKEIKNTREQVTLWEISLHSSLFDVQALHDQ